MSRLEELLRKRMMGGTAHLEQGFMPQTAPQPAGALNLSGGGVGSPTGESAPQDVLGRLSAMNPVRPPLYYGVFG